MGQTAAEKIISEHAGKEVHAGELVVVSVDAAMASDTTAPLAIEAFYSMGGSRLWQPKRCILVIDHAAPAPNERIANLHAMMRTFARAHGCHLYESGEGICHQLLIENSHIKPGQILIGADSHTCASGAVGALGIGVGSTDFAAVCLTGKIWLKVPGSLRITISGDLSPGVQSKDLALSILKRTGESGATYHSVEIGGDTVAGLSLAGRIVVSSMLSEAGAKTAFIATEGLSLPFDCPQILPDPDAVYQQQITLNASNVPPMISLPHSPANAISIDEVEGRPIDSVFIGTCANGRHEDLKAAADILKKAGGHCRSRIIVCPASRRVLQEALSDGTIQTLVQSGALLLPPGCGPCVGTHNGIPANGERVISTGNRNFKGRMGNPQAEVYLASPATVAASAVDGKISDPRKYF